MKNYNSIKNYILKNGGITLDINTMENTNKKKGFSVSLEGYEVTSDNITEVMQSIKDYKKIIEKLENKNLFVGVWYNEDNGLYYIDISEVINEKRKALQTAKQNKQLAIYDLKKQESIYLNYDIKFYSIYKKNGEDLIFKDMFDTIKEVSEYLRLSVKQVYNIINNKEENPSYKIFSDYISIKEYHEGI